MKTKYAPAERQSIDNISLNNSSLQRFPYLEDIFCSLSYIFCILNKERQIVFINDVLMKTLGIDKVEQVLGQRFGEAFGCIHSKDEEGGCGTSAHCRYCGAVNSVLDSYIAKKKITKECRIRRIVDGEESSIEIEATATPFTFEGEDYTIFSLIDITDKKRRGLIERIFFHDILNTAGSLNNIFEVLEMVEDKEKPELMTIASSLSKQIIDEITTQRLLLQVESASLVVDTQRINSLEFLDVVEKDLRYHEVAKGKKTVLDQTSDSLFFTSDPVILRKIINNMVKNAFEASEPGESVSLKGKRVGDKLQFSVHNNAFISPEVEMQIFMRSFSTKGMQRGLGTYSMKILGEKYLGGKVNFVTDPVKGTTFFIELGNIETA